MAKRMKMSRQQSRKNFKRGAKRVHARNVIATPVMRGGIRL